MDTDQPIVGDDSYSFEQAILAGIEIEEKFGALDLGPIDTLEPHALQLEYHAFCGSSPLSSLSPSLSPSTPPSKSSSIDLEEMDPEQRERALDRLFGASPLSSVPSSPPSPSTSTLPTSTELKAKPVNTKSNSKTRRNKKKGHENRCEKRQVVREKDGKPPQVKKHIAAAETTKTSFNTKNIPSAATGFIALPDGDTGKYHKLRPLLQHHRLKLIRWRGR